MDEFLDPEPYLTSSVDCSKDPRAIPRNRRAAIQAEQFKTPSPNSALVRTGCIPCLKDRVKCDGSNPRCQKTTVTTLWRINNDSLWRTQGTWRERKGIHSFINYALGPERSGLFQSFFWQTVMQACFSNAAVFHIACAVGSLQEQILQQSTRRKFNDLAGLDFALRQCNKAINLLVASATSAQDGKCDPGIPLITCVLFALFEALNGDSDQAINHSLQGRKLLCNCETLALEGRGSRIVDPMTVRPVISGLEIQAKAIQGKHMDTRGSETQPPMPDIERIHGLDHANWTLHYAYVSLLVFCQSVSLAMTKIEILAMMREKADFFGSWFERWDQAFSDFLFREGHCLSQHDMQRAKVLKINHLAAMMLATTDQSMTEDIWATYNAECKAIIDLSASVLNTHSLGSPTTLSTFQFPYLSFGLWVAEPLFIVMARCRIPELQRQAAGLLQGQPRADHAERILVKKSHHWIALDGRTSRKDTDNWDIDQWIEFCAHTRLDAAMATYFARLPSRYIDKPVFYSKV